MLRRSPMKRTRMKRGTTRLRGKSETNGRLAGTNKVAYQAELRAAVALLAPRARHRCEHPRCRRRGPLDPHHIMKRSAGGANAPTNLVLLCRDCHNWTDESLAGARGRLTPYHLTDAAQAQDANAQAEVFGFAIMRERGKTIDGTDVVYYERRD